MTIIVLHLYMDKHKRNKFCYNPKVVTSCKINILYQPETEALYIWLMQAYNIDNNDGEKCFHAERKRKNGLKKRIT